MTKAKTSTKTMGDGAMEAALFTHDGYRLHVFDGVPYMTDDDLADRLGFGQDRDIRKLIKRQEENLQMLGEVTGTFGGPSSKPRHSGAVSNGLLRRKADRKDGARGPIGTAYYLNQQQVRWIVIKSGMPQADVLLRQLFSVFDAWEKGQLVSRAEAAEAKLAASEDTRPIARHPNWPRYYGHEHSMFLMAGAPAAIPYGFIESVKKDNRFTRFETTLNLTATATEDQIRIFDVDLGHAIGGQCTNKVRPRVRELQQKLRLMGPDPWHQIEAYRHLGHSYDLTSVFLLNHEQAKAIAAVMDPDGHSDIHYRLDLLFYHIANGRLAELARDDHAAMIAGASDARAKASKTLPERYRAIPMQAPPAALPPVASDPFQLIMLQEAATRALGSLSDDLAELATLCRALKDDQNASRLRAEVGELRALIEGHITNREVSNLQTAISKVSGLLGRMRGRDG